MGRGERGRGGEGERGRGGEGERGRGGEKETSRILILSSSVSFCFGYSVLHNGTHGQRLWNLYAHYR